MSTTVKVTKDVLLNALRRQLSNEVIAASVKEGKGKELVQAHLYDLHQMVVGTPVVFAGLFELAMRGLSASPDDVAVNIIEIDGEHGQKLEVKVKDTVIGHFRYDADGQNTEEHGVAINAQLWLSPEAIMGLYRVAAMGPFQQLMLPPPTADAIVS